MAEGENPWLVVGADGGIGRVLLDRLGAAGAPAVGTTRRRGEKGLFLDLAADPDEWRLPARVEVAYLCAAATSMARCQADPAGTRLVNVKRTLRLADLLRDRGAHVVFLSSNQVFDGGRPFPTETDPPCPVSEYGRQKAEVERALLSATQATTAAVVRLTKVVAPDWPLLRGWAERLRRGESVEAFHDMVMAPLRVEMAAELLLHLGRHREVGLFHISGDRDVSYATAARLAAEAVGASPNLVRPTSARDAGIPAESLPAHTALGSTRPIAKRTIIRETARTTIQTVFKDMPALETVGNY